MPSCTLATDEAFGAPRELAGAVERAEEVGGAVVDQPAGGALWVDGHLADGVDGQRRLSGGADADGGDELDRIADVAQLAPAARLVDHALDRRRERGGLRGEQDLAADGRR